MTGSVEAAEDITQDCFLALLRGQERYDASRGELRSFLLGIARNIVSRRWRNESRWETLDDDQFCAAPIDPGTFQTAELVAKAVQSLPPLQREVLVLAEYEEMKLEDIARAAGAELSTVKGRLFRARENLRRILAPLRKTTCTH